MGCGASTSRLDGTAPDDDHHQSTTTNTNNNNKQQQQQNPSGGGVKAAESLSRCLDKYLNESGAISTGDGNVGVCVLFTPQDNYAHFLKTKDSSSNAKSGTSLNITYYDKKTSKLYSLELPDEAALMQLRDAAGIPSSTTWGLFVKSVAADIIKHKARCSVSADGKHAHVTCNVNLSKSSDAIKTMTFNLPLNNKNNNNTTTNNTTMSWNEQFRLFVEPSIRIVKQKRSSEDRKEKQKKLEEIAVTIANTQKHQKFLIEKEQGLNERTTAIRRELDKHSREVIPSNMKARSIQRRLYYLQKDKQMEALDKLYEEGRLPPTVHLLRATPHTPNPLIPSTHLINVLKNAGAAYKNFAQSQDAAQQWKSMLSSSSHENHNNNNSGGGDNFLLNSIPSACPGDERKMIEGVLSALSKVDEWGFDVFELDNISGGNALFCVTLALLLRLDLPRSLGVDMNKLVAFLLRVQAGYHPNPYHNSTHAADVTQINYFILTRGGLAVKCGLSKEEIFASIVAAAVHDYDHPGFNNSFHNRTASYLSTLYNDRSVLENHHLASVFEMMMHPSANILSDCSEASRKDIRDTMCEMVLSTDMGMHQKIFDSFRNRIGDSSSPRWDEKVEDRRLGLSMAIKMADVSNTCRPRNLYLPWVHCLSQEFYHQGDHEKDLGMPISPFMDRDKHSDLPRGQISFINFVIMPMFESAAHFLPNLRFCTDVCAANKQYWQTYQVMRQM